MRNIASLLLIAFYLLGSLGLRKESHFCGGELVYSSILAEVSPDQLTDSDPHEQENEGCCSNRIITLKLDDGKNLCWIWLPIVQVLALTENGPFFSGNTLTDFNPKVLGFSGWKDPPPDGIKSGLYLIFRHILI